MKVFLTGATGVLGREVVRQVGARGHTVMGTARSEKGEEIIRLLGGEAYRVDLFDADALARAGDGADVVIHGATAIPVKPKTSPQDWEMNDRIRRDGTQALTAAAEKIGAKAYLQQSITWVARPPDGGPFDEDSPAHPDAVTQSSLDGEEIAREAGARHAFTVSVLRCGAFYGPDAGHTRMLGELLRKRELPVIGAGDAVWAMIHTEDAAGAFVAAAEQPRSGLWHVVDDVRITVREFLEEFARRLGAPPPRRAPVWLAKVVAGENAVQYFTSSTRTTNARFRGDFGWAPRYPSIREGLEQVVAAWREEQPR